ncbi:Ni/Fe hydrogenase subunit alpha [Acidocella aromatica]|uniref:Coenzyme F420-reducing hydrogenase alpha subunit n=1 Tax=Acidocella aromatica TaxID=1303579 RepID=A0A840VB07_9PROT|nr:nickel-dependent hydrogenase large subunit [Acidocella aromatica]MBB5373098.1 coenzyme F420-reducing hydrogenase alpha subunit [Acidocella aromatica]
MSTRRIEVDLLTRVEGEGALDIEIENGGLKTAHLRIFEPPRFFEALLRGRDYAEIPDITARICGICPIAYQMGAVQAVERAFGADIPAAMRDLRRLLYCGEWIESHALHVVMLHAPDFCGLPDGIALAREQPGIVRAGLALKKTGNALMRVIGGREIHPVNLRPGGVFRLPTRAELAALAPALEEGRETAIRLFRWAAALPFPEVERDYEFVALRHGGEYPITAGRLASSRGLDIDIGDFETEFEERQVTHSTALHALRRNGGAYLTGPLARYALNSNLLPETAKTLAEEAGLGPVCRNPYKSILVRCLEMLFACEEALRLIAAYTPPAEAFQPLTPRAATGFGCTEAPRGICWHRYDFAGDGSVLAARIVAPTTQNQPAIEEDLVALVGGMLAAPDDAIRAAAEAAIRNHDPCISCATHFLRLSVRRA